MVAGLFAALLASAGCGHRYVALTVDRACSGEAIDEIDVVITVAGRQSRPSRLMVNAETSWPIALALELPPDATGAASVMVTAKQGGAIVSTGASSGRVGAPSWPTVELPSPGCAPMADFATAPDLTVLPDQPDLSMPIVDLAMPDLAVSVDGGATVCTYDDPRSAYDTGCVFQ